MAEYQNLFTAVQVTGPLHHGVEQKNALSPRTGEPWLWHLAGRLGNAQIGPIYLGVRKRASIHRSRGPRLLTTGPLERGVLLVRDESHAAARRRGAFYVLISCCCDRRGDTGRIAFLKIA